MPPPPATVTTRAPGKVNLTLEILGKRPDGYHDLRSVLLPVSLYETITVTERADGGVTCHTDSDGGVALSALRHLPLEEQLAVKALRVMQRLCGAERRGADISIIKRVPIGAGMGGGSADAAGVMRALCELWNADIPEEDLLAAAASIGSDVPALLAGGPVLMEGRGERITRLAPPCDNMVMPDGLPPLASILTHGFFPSKPLPQSKLHLVVVFPDIAVPTKSIYQNFYAGRKPCESASAAAIRAVLDGDARAAAAAMVNDLQDTVFRLHPEIIRFRDLLLEAGALAAQVSGSGSALFGIANNAAHAVKIQSRLPADTWSRALETVSSSAF